MHLHGLCIPIPQQLVRFFNAKQPAKRICLASIMDSTMWRVSLQCFTDDVKVLLNGVPDKRVKNVAINKKKWP